MDSIAAQMFDELGYDPDDGVPQLIDACDRSESSNRSQSTSSIDVSDLLPGGRMLEIGDVVAARIGARRVAVARLGSGKLVVVADECPHDGGRISDGFVEGEHLVCARHGWTLEARDGRCERACKLRE